MSRWKGVPTHDDTPRCPDRVTRTSADASDGFTLIEIIVVLVITSIMMGGVAFMWASGRRAGNGAIGVSTAVVYQQAIEQFASDHGGRVPTAIGGQDWPGAADAKLGPKSPLARHGGYYLRGVPESVTTGLITVGSRTGSATTWLEYRPSGSNSYALIVHGDQPAHDCALGNQTPSGMMTCVNDR